MIGIFSDSHGDVGAFDRAYRLLKEHGAKRFFFPGGNWTDLDEWVAWRNEKARETDYSNADFLADVAGFLSGGEQVDRPAAFGRDPVPDQDPEMAKIKDRFVRTPEHDCIQFEDPQIEKKVVDMLGDVLCTVLYDKNDLVREDMLNAAVFIHGKERQPKVVQIGPRYFITAGMLQGAPEQTCGLLEVLEKERSLRFSAYTLDGRTVIDQQVIPLGSKTKISVK